MKFRIIKVECQCDFLLLKYKKAKRGRLVKCYFSRISYDYIRLPDKIAVETKIFCPNCKKRIGTILNIKGMLAIKLNQGQIKPARLG